MNTNYNDPIRVMMFPWLAHGHITPYLELAIRLITRGFTIYMCSTPATLSGIQKKITQKLSLYIKQVPLHLPTSPDLPPKFHTTNGLPLDLMRKLKEAFDSSVDNFSDILKNVKPDLLIYDCLQSWAPLVAKEHNIPAVEFITASPTMYSLAFHSFKYPGVEFPFSSTIYHRHSSEEKMLRGMTCRDKEVQFECVERSCKIVLIKGCRDIEDKYLDYVGSLLGKKFVPVGPLVQNPDDDDEISLDISSWLDQKEKKSTIFVSFGTEYFLTNEEIDEIAHGLELSGIDFAWVLRVPNGSDDDRNKKLPEGFLERVGDRGKVIDWAPQKRILGHPNIGGFVSHCGWNSVMESMYFGVPIIALPMHLDQPINARLVREVGVGVEVLRDEHQMIDRDLLASVIRRVVVDDSGESVRQRAVEMSEKLISKEDENIDEVVKELMDLCNNYRTSTY